MLVIRPIRSDDIDQFLALVEQAGHGLTTLPKDRGYLQKRIDASLQSFAKQTAEPQGESYLFVLEDLDHGRVVGTCGIVSKVGGFEPFYAYKIETSVHESKTLGVRKEVRALHLVREHSGPTEIGSLFLAPDYRKGGNGRVLSLSRFLFMAQHSSRFESQVIAEMRGVVDKQGHSPFWDALGRHFFEIEYPTADYLSIVNKKFIADLMPAHPIYIPLLPEAAQRIIGQVHENTRPAQYLLESEGFQANGMVDIFEAGPVVTCQLEQVRIVKECCVAKISQLSEQPIESQPYLISNTQSDFRACRGSVAANDDGTIRLSKLTAIALKLKIGDPVRYAPLFGPDKREGTK